MTSIGELGCCQFVSNKANATNAQGMNPLVDEDTFKEENFHHTITLDLLKRVKTFYDAEGLSFGLEEARMMSRGAFILEAINKGNSEELSEPHLPNQSKADKAKENLRDLMWYVEADSFANCGGGAISAMHCCPDSERKFYDFLEKTAEATGESYARPSSHFSKRIEKDEKEKKTTQMGVDIDGLPGGKSTILFGKLEKGVTFFKMELYGCAPFLKAGFRTWKNFFNFCGHAIELIRAMGQKFGLIAATEGARKEKLDHGVVEEATRFINASYEDKIKNIDLSYSTKLNKIIDDKKLLWKDPGTLRLRPEHAKGNEQLGDRGELFFRLRNSRTYDQEINKSIEAEKRQAAESRKQDLEEIKKGSRNLAKTVRKVEKENEGVSLQDFTKLKASVKAFDSRCEEDKLNRVTDVQRDGNEYIHDFMIPEFKGCSIPLALGAITA